MASSTDRIEKKVHLKAPRARVWKALTDAEEFGRWFGVKLEGPFVPGERARGRITHPGYEHVTMEIVVDRMEPEHTFAWRWHPAAVEPDVDYASEPMTVVAFTLEEQDGGTLLTVVESGFDAVPMTRRQTALRLNTEGWEGQMRNIERHVG